LGSQSTLPDRPPLTLTLGWLCATTWLVALIVGAAAPRIGGGELALEPIASTSFFGRLRKRFADFISLALQFGAQPIVLLVCIAKTMSRRCQLS